MKELSKNINAQEIIGKNADENFLNSQIKFALKLFQNIMNKSNSKQNMIISPYSIVQALGMLANGAKDITKFQIEKMLGNIPIEDLKQYLYRQRISQPNAKNCKLMTVNSIWFRDDKLIEVKKDFLQTNADYYHSSIFTAPFDDSTVTEINKWVNKHTNTMIPKLLDKIFDEAILYLINAVAFHAKWQTPYEVYQVQNGKFKNADGKKQTVKMMHSIEDDYLEDEQATGFLKYYQGGRYAFMTLLPNENISVIDYIKNLKSETFQNLIYTKKRKEVIATMPKFSYDYELELSDILSAMGMPDAFHQNADFSGMAEIANNYLAISEIIHKTHIDVFENGTKTAAVTGAVACAGCCAMLERKTVILDRPFIYGILDMENNLPIFLGALNFVR